jgi:hypothetical protein
MTGHKYSALASHATFVRVVIIVRTVRIQRTETEETGVFRGKFVLTALCRCL